MADWLRMNFDVLERKFSVTTFPGLAISRLATIRMRIVAEWTVKFFISVSYRRRALGPTRKAQGSKNQKIALVVGNGPSVEKLNWEQIALKKKLGLELFVVNYFPLSPNYVICQPDYLVLSDPKTKPEFPDPRNAMLWKKIRSDDFLRIIVPISWYPTMRLDETIAGRIFYFDDSGLEGWTKNISPTRARGYIALTAYKALAMSIYFGYKRSYVIGIDNSMFKNIVVNEQNELIENPNHFFSQGGIVRNVGAQYPNGIADYFNDMALCFYSLRQCFVDKGIINLDMESLVDCFEKQSEIDFN